MNDDFFRKIVSTGILMVLLVLSFFILKPVLLSVIMGIILAVIFSPSYDWLAPKIRSKNAAALIICVILIALLLLPFFLITPLFIRQSFEVFRAAQQLDFAEIFSSIAPPFIGSDELIAEISPVLNSFVTKTISSILNSFSGLILNFPTIALQFLVVFFTMFFILRDKEHLISYIQSLMPFSKEVENKFFKSSKDLTMSIIYGQVVVGILQGLIAGAGFFIFGVNNAMFLTFLATIAGIMPIIGTTIVWLPVAIFLLIGGSNNAAIGVVFFGLISTFIDNILRPMIVSRRTSLHPLVILIGMVGGFFLFGVIGFILGPLVLAYVLIVLEVYRGKDLKGVFVK